MKLQDFLGYGLPAIMLIVLLAGSYVIFACSRRRVEQKVEADRRQGKLRAQTGAAIVETVRTNNSVPYLEETFENLFDNLKAQDMELNINLRGYTTDAE